MTSTLISGARTTVAVAAAALLLVTGCDDGTGQSAPPESPAEQGTEAAGDESAGADEEAPADDASAGEEGADAEGDSGTEGEQDAGAEGGPDDGADDPISGDPCADLSSEDISAVFGSEVGDREDEASQGLPEGAESESLVICTYTADSDEIPSASLYWMLPIDDYPDEMPEDLQQEQNESRASDMVAGGEEIDVAGAAEATVEISTAAGVTQVTIKAAVDGAVLNSTVMAAAGSLDESDIPTAVELAELAISKA